MTRSRAPKDAPHAQPARLSRREAVSRGGALALAAACGLSVSPPPFPSGGPEPAFARLRDAAGDVVVGGERLGAARLRRFYARHGFSPVWPERERVADSLAGLVLRAGEHGLDPDLFHAPLLRRASELSPLDRDLALTDALLAYADALAHGAVPVGRRGPAQELVPEPVDAALVLDAALGAAEPSAAVEALAPKTPGYAALRRALQGHASATDPAGRARARTLAVNLERQRWLPRAMPADRVWVNVADQTLSLRFAEREVFLARAVVGDEAERNQSPEFRTRIEGAFFNPPWVVPRDIVELRFLPRMREDPDFLAKNNMVLRENGEIEQRPGPNAALGVVMLDMPNRFDVYVHDTPGRHLFERPERRASHGCIRVENPRALAALLFDVPLEAIDRKVAAGETTRVPLPRPVPIFVAYQTAFADAAGEVRFRPDFYGRDERIWRQLRRRADGGAESAVTREPLPPPPGPLAGVSRASAARPAAPSARPRPAAPARATTTPPRARLR